MPIQNDILKRIYRDMYISGLTNDSEEEWNKRFFANGEEGYKNRKGVYDTLKKNGAIVGDSYEEFAGNIGLRANPKKKSSSPYHASSSPAPASAPTAPSAPKVQDKSSLTTAAKQAPATTEASRKAEQIMGQLSSIGKTAQASYNPAETRTETADTSRKKVINDSVPTSVVDSSTTPQNRNVDLLKEEDAQRIMDEKRKRFEAKEKDYREKKPILEKEHDEALKEREKELKLAWEATQGPVFGPGGTYYNVHAAEMMTKNSNDRVHQSRKALQTLEEAHIERNQKSTEGFFDAMGRRLKHFGQDIQEGDMSLFDFGVSEANSYANVLRIVRKVNNGEELTPEEMKVMHVRALQQAVEDGHGDDIGYGYKAMGVTIESLPFMLEMAINPLSGFGKGMAKTAAGRLVKKGVSRAVNRTLGGYIGKKASVTAGRIATRVVGDAIGAAGMAATSGAARVAGDAERRMAGDVTYENADNGDVVYTGNVNQASAGTALFKAFGSVAIENHSEMLGDYFAPILGAVSRKAGKILDKVEVTGVGKKIHLNDARKFINDVKSSDVAKLIDDFQEQTHWDGVIGEYAEEVVGGIENALLVGDEKLTTDEGGVFNLERNIETFLGVGLMGGFMSAVKTLGYRTPHYRQMQDLKRQARDIENSVQNKEAWHEIRAGIDNENDEDTKAAITAALTDPSFSEDERRSILDYAKKSYQLRGSVAATASETEEKAAAGVADAQDDYNEGRAVAQSASPIDLYNAQREYDTAYEMMAVQLGDRMAEQVRGMEEEDLTAYVGEATKENGWSEEDIFALNQYASAKARLDGINDSVSERVQERVDNAKAEMDKRTGDDGNVTSVTLKVGDRKVYVTGGNLVTFEDGSINAQESSQEITVYDPSTDKTEMISPRDILSIDSTVNADEELASASAAVEEEVAGPVRQGMEGGIDITTGTAIPSMKGVITVGEEVLDENGAPTGTYNVDVNGEAAVMSEDEIRSAYDELKARVDEERAVAAERGRSEREAARNEEEYRQQVGVGDDVTFVRDGKRISGRAVMDYDEDSLIVDVEEGARTRSYNVRREEIVAPGTAVEEDTPVVDDNAVQEDDVQTDTGYATAQEQEETETTDTPAETGTSETVAPAPADNGTTTSAPSTDEVAVGQETAAPAQAPAHAVQSEQQQQGPANGTATPANGNVGIPAADTATMQRESGNATANGTATAANTPASAQDIVSDKNTPMPINEDTGEPDYARATPERTREFLYNESGLEADEADAYVGNNAEQAREELEKAKNSKPKMEKGKTLTQFLSEKAAWQQQMDEAQRNVDYWEGVKNAGQETAPGIAPVQDATNGAAHVDAGTDAQNMGQTAAPAAGEQRASLRRKSYVIGEQAAVLAKAEEETNVEPTEAQKKAGNYKKGHLKIDGFNVSIEQPKGSVRRGTDASGRQWEQTMNNTYGYIRGTEGVDGDHIDVFLSDDPSHGDVFVIDQVNKDGTFDEHKVMYGFADEESARQAYLSNYEKGWTGLGAITHVSKDEFKKWVQSSHRKTKPFAEYKGVKTNQDVSPTSETSLPVHKDFAKYVNNVAGTVAMVSGDGERGYVVRYYQDDADANAGIAIGEVIMTPQEFKDKLESGALAPADATMPTLSQDSDQVSDQDKQGNPLNADGSLKLEKVSSVYDLTDEDFSAPSRNVQLPKLPKNVDEAIGANGKPVIIKKNIFARNSERHSELTPADSRDIIDTALYNPDLYGQNQKSKRAYNWVVINIKDKDGRNRLVLLEVNENKENVEIVHWHYIDERGLNKIKRQAEREGGQLLILPSNEEEAGALSSRTQSLSSAGKVSESSISDKNNAEKVSENQQESAENAENNAQDASLRNGRKSGNAKQDNAGEASAKMRSMMERIAEKLGYRIEWHETMEQNGLFDPKTKTIHIALDAENPLAAVFGHESMHRIAENAEDYKSILALAKEVLGEKEFERRVDDAEKRYRDAGYDKPRSYYEEEAVCDFMGEMLDNDRLLERVCWDANHRVLAAIRNVIDRILAAIGMADARLMHVRLTVSAAYNNAIRRTETEGEVPTKEGELRASLLRKHDVDRMSTEYHSGKKTGITKKVFDAAQKAMDAMYEMMMPYYEATALGKRMLPEERYGRKGAASTIFSNGSYGKTMENTLKCIRTLAYNEFTDDVKRALGRPLTQKESFLASQMVYDISSDPQCLYCYVSLDRKAYDEFLLRYMQQRDGVLGKFREMDASKRAIGKTAPHTALPELYAEFLDKRKDTKQQQERFDMWIRNEIDGAETITAADISTADVRSAVLEGLDASMARQVKDAEKYAQSASWAKKDVDYISYVGELLKLSPAWIKKLTGEYGLRFYSFSEYTPAFLLENMQMVRDAALRGLRGLGYTKELDFVKVFAPTGMNINCSCYGRMDSDGNMQMDTRQGADWEEVKRLRGQYRNVGAVFVATNDAAVEWALAQDWIDVVIPFHIVRTGQDIADFYGWSNYSKEQADSVVGSSKKMYISPVEHKNDKAAFLAACEKHGVTPRFAKWLDNPNYMKLVNETRLSVDESSDLQPVFDMDAAADSWKRFVNTGGYYNGWWNVDAEGYADAVRTVVEDIRSGKMANEVDYGRQDVPANVEKMVAAARKKRIHGNVPLVDVYDRSGNALSSGEQRASLRKQKAGSSESEDTEADRALRDALNDVLTRAGIDVVTDVEEGQRVLDEVNGDEVREQKGYYDPRSSISPVRGKWTKEKIVRRLKDLRGAITGYKAAASRIAEFDSAEELADHMFYHGTQFGGGSLKPSILMSDRDIERIGGGGYGDKYWGVSVSRRKDIASRFSSGRSVRIYPIILVKNAKVKEMPNLDDAADLEDYIVDLWKEGVDAVWIGDKNKGEQELCVLNPRAIVNIDTADTYDYFQLGTEENPLHVIDNDGIKKLYDDAVRYVNARRNTPKKPLLPSRFYPGKEGEILGERKSDDVYEREFAEYKRRLDEYNNSEEAKRLNDEEEYARRNIRFFRTADGNAYGFTVNGKVYIDPRMVNAETPIHEYTHLWATALRERKPKEWKNVVELMKGTDVWDEVVRTYPELKTDDEIADEVLAQYSGRRGAERLRQEMDDVLKSDSGITEKAAAVRAINNVRAALNSFWRSVARMLGLRYTSAEDVADCVLRDMLNLEKPGEKPAKEDLKYMMGDSSETFQERQKRAVANKGTVMPGLNEAQVKVVDVPRHEYEGNWFEAVGKAVHDAIKKFTRIEKDEKGKEKRVSIPQHYNNFGAKFDYIISKKSIEESINEKQVKKSLEGEAPRGVHLAVLNNLDKVISESIEVEEHPDYIKKDGKRSPENGFKSDILVHRFIGAIRVDEKEYRVKTTMYEYKQTDRKSREYAYDVTKIEVLDDTTTSTSDDLVGATMGLKPLAKLLKDVEKSYDKGKKILEESKLADENAPIYREGESVDDSMTESESQEDYDLYRTVEDEDTIEFLEGQPSVTTYRSMALIDGKLYPPMSSKEMGSKKLRNPSELGKWEESEESPDKAYKKGNGWYFDLKKDNGKTVSGVAYNPYIHTSTTMLNDQFSEAQERDNLVVVEMHVPESELTSRYQAAKAKDSVGVKEWKAGIIQGMLSGTREVILTRWAKPVRIVPVEEVAENIAKMIEGKVEVMPSNVVTPQQRKALEERGVDFVETDNKGKIKDGEHAGKTWSSVYGKKAKSARKKNDSPSRIKSAVETLYKKLNLDNVEILDDASGLEGKRKKAKGFYNRKTGKITIVLSNATSVSDAVQTLLHEAVAHYGLRKMFGGNFDTFLDNVFRNADESVRRKISELSRKHDFNIRTATEEYLASLAEDTNFEKENAGWWNKVKALFADMLRNMGFENFGGITLSDNELRYILWRSYRNLAESGNGVFSTAEDTAKQSALNVGEFSTEDTADADLYRVGDDAMEEYHRQVNRSFKSKFREAWIDGMMSVKAAMDAISNELSERIEDFENPYLFENQMHGISRVQSEVFQRRYFEPMVRKFNAILNDYDLSEEDLYKYLIAKHGIERNYVFAMRDANRAFEEEQKKDPNTTKSVMDFYKPRDYSGLTSLMEENRVNVAENEAEAYVSVIESMCGQDLDELWDLINSCTKWTLRHSYECGELSRGQYENIRDMFKHYIPLRGWDGTNAQDVYDYIGSKSGVYSGMVKAKGRRSVADNPIAYIGNMAISQIISGNRNRLKQHAYRMAQNHPTSLFTVGEQWYENFGDEKNPKWMVVYPDIKESDTPDVVSQKFDDFYQRMKSLEAQHKAKRKRGHEQIEYPATNSQKHQHIVRCKMNGKEYVLYVNGNPRFAQAINGELSRNAADASQESQSFFAGVSRWMANNFTSRNPAFIISNAARDMQMAMQVMGIKEGAAYQALLGKNMSKLLFPNLKKKGFAMMPDLMKKFEEGTLAARGVERYFKEFMERGGETGFTSLKDVEQMKLDIISLTRHDQQGRLNPSRALRALGDTFEYYNRCVEDMSRFAVYMTSRQRGKSIAQSIDDAKNCTLNFNRKGSGAMGNATFRHLYIFVNPAIQALSMLFESAKKHPFRLTATLAGNLIAGAVIPVVNTMCMAALGGDDDDYWNLPVWERRNNIVIWVPGTKRFITIPLPQEMRCFYGLGEAAVSCMMGHGGEHPAMEVMDQFLDLLPISFTGAGGNMLVNLSPTMLQPLMQIYANTDFTGKPIYRDNEGSKYEPLFQKAYSGTPSWMVKTSKFINDLTGGDTHEQGWYEKTLFGKWANNPAIVNHLLKGYYGGVYSFISGTAGMLTTALGGEMPKTYEIPIVNRFIKDPTERKSAMLPDWYWDIVDERDRYRSEIRRWKDDAKKGDEHAYEKLVEKHQGIEYERYMMRDSYIKQIDEVRKYIKATDDEEEVKMAEEYVRGLSGQLRKLNNLDDEELEKVSRLPSSEFQYLMDMTPKEISKYLKKMPSANEEQQ